MYLKPESNKYIIKLTRELKEGRKMIHATTIVAVKKNNQIAMAGDGQVTFGQSTVMKHQAKKVRRLYNGKVIAGFLPVQWLMPLHYLKNLKEK